MQEGSKLAVSAAIGGNAILTAAKFVAFLVSGSGAMLSEAIHSFADTLNQALLMIGVVRSGRPPDRRFPDGYGAEQVVWALISAVGIFFLGCGVTVYHGVHSLLHPGELGALGWAIAVLGFSFALDGAVLVLALRTAWKAAAGRPFLRYLRREADAATVAVIMEDSAACLGVVIALLGVLLARLTGSPVWDAAGSIGIGLLLGAIAIWLIVRNHRMLVGPAAPPDVEERIRTVLRGSPLVEKVVRLRTRVLDAGTFRIAADLDLSGAAVAAQLEERIRSAWAEIRSFEDFRAFCGRFAEDVVEKLGDEIDVLEAALRQAEPGARHIEIEAD